MRNYNRLIQEARAMFTQVEMNQVINRSWGTCHLKALEYIRIIRENIPFLESNIPNSFLSKLTNLLFDTLKKRVIARKANELKEAVHHLRFCLKCKCVNCPLVNETCRCVGCLYGSRVVSCREGTEIREVDLGVIYYGKKAVNKLSYYKATGKTVATDVDGVDHPLN